MSLEPPQHKLSFTSLEFIRLKSIFLFLSMFPEAGAPIRFLISAVIVIKTCSTLVLFLADVSKYGIPKRSEYSLAVV